MQPNLSALIEAATKRSGVSLELLTDAKQISAVDWANQFPGLSTADRARVSRVPDAVSYETLNASITSALAYAAGSWEGGLAAVIEDCENYVSMAQFMRAVLDLLLENPRMFEGVTLNPTKLAEIRRKI